MDLDELDNALTGQEVTTTEAVTAVVIMLGAIAIAFIIGRLAERRFGRPDAQGEQLAKLTARALEGHRGARDRDGARRSWPM